MNKYQYFEYEGDIPSHYSFIDTIKERLTSAYAEAEIEAEEMDALKDEGDDIPEEPVEEKEELKEPEPSVSETAVPEPQSLSRAELNELISAFEERESAPKEHEKANVPKDENEPEHKQEVKKKEKEKKNVNPLTVALLFLKNLKPKKRKKREVTRLKKFFITLLLFLLLIAVAVGIVYIFMNSINKENERIKKFNANAAKVCADYTDQYGNAAYENLYNTYGVEGYRLTGLCFVRELDFDNNGESELMIAYNKNGVYYNEVWGINEEGSFERLFSAEAAQTDKRSDDTYSILYHSSNKYYIARFDSENNNKMQLYQLKNGKFTERYKAKYVKKTKSYSVDGKDDTNAFEQIRYSVLKEEKAALSAEGVLKTIDGFTVGGIDERLPEEEQSLKNAYYSIVQEYNKRYGVAEIKEDGYGNSYVSGLASVKLVDFDGDGKEELLLVYRKTIKVRDENASDDDDSNTNLIAVDKYFCDIYRYSGNRAILTYSNEGISNKLNSERDTYYILRYKNKTALYCINSFTSSDYGKHINAVSTQLEFNGTEFKSNFKASYSTDYGYTKYYLKGASVNKAEFDEKGYVLPFFDGGEDYDEDIFDVVYVQRNSANAGDLKNVPSKTEKEIQKLNQLYTSDMIQ